MHPYGIDDLIEETYAAIDAQGAASTRTLDEYLRALWGLVLLHRQDGVSYDLLATVLAKSLTAPPLPFDDTWLTYADPPLWDDNSLLPFEFLERVILFQIADLRRIEASDIRMGYLDNVAPSGHTWNNFEIKQYLECAMGGMASHVSGNTEIAIRYFPERPTWRTLAAILELGRLYE